MLTNDAAVKSGADLVALSVSLCIRDMIRVAGRVDPRRVRFFYAGTRAETPADWRAIAAHYRVAYWRDNPDLGERILMDAVENGRVIQPRLEGRPVARDVWVTAEDFNRYVAAL